MNIERADVGDADGLLALQRLAYQSEAQLYQDPTIAPLRETLAELVAEFETHVFLKATVDGTLVGSVRAICADGVCSIGRLMVHPQWQGQGIGTALMQHIEAHFHDAQQFKLFTGARSVGNIRLYHRLGYATIATEVLNDRVTIVVMAKPG